MDNFRETVSKHSPIKDITLVNLGQDWGWIISDESNLSTLSLNSNYKFKIVYPPVSLVVSNQVFFYTNLSWFNTHVKSIWYNLKSFENKHQVPTVVSLENTLGCTFPVMAHQLPKSKLYSLHSTKHINITLKIATTIIVMTNNKCLYLIGQLSWIMQFFQSLSFMVLPICMKHFTSELSEQKKNHFNWNYFLSSLLLPMKWL